MRISRASEVLGARVEGLDLREPLDADTVKTLKAAWLEHLVLIFPDQEITPAQLAEFSRNFGELVEHPITAAMPKQPMKGARSEVREILPVKLRGGKSNIGPRDQSWEDGWEAPVRPDGWAARGWHADVTCMENPPAYTMLYGKQPLEMEGVDDDTCFCNMYRAYENLSPGLKEFLRPRSAYHTARILLRINQNKDDASYEQRKAEAELGIPYEQLHPCVRLHPESGRPSLYLNANFTERFEGWTNEESKPLIDALLVQATKDENIYRHKWSKGDLVCWDDRCTLHRGPASQLFPKGAVRDMFRTTVTPANQLRLRPQGVQQGGISRL